MPDTPGEDRSIRKIPITTSHRNAMPHDGVAHPHTHKKTSPLFWGTMAVLVAVVGGLLLSTLFESATVFLLVRTETIALPPHVVASQDASTGGLVYTIVPAATLPDGYLPIQGTLNQGNIAALDSRELARAVAKQMIRGYADEPVLFPDLSTVKASVATSTPLFGRLTVSLSGTSTLVWQVDPHAVTEALVGQNKKDVARIALSFGSGVVEAHLTSRPFWKATLPNDEGRLQVTTSPNLH